MESIPLLGLGVQSGYPSVTAQKRINCYLEQVLDVEKSTIVAYGIPGLDLFKDLGETPIRGIKSVGDYLYCAHRGNVYKINNAGVATLLGTMTSSSGRVGIESNGSQVCFVDGTTTGYVYGISEDTTVTITIASPGVVTWANHGFKVNTAIQFSTTGSLPTGITAGTTYYVSEVVDADSFKISATHGGSDINTSGSQSGTHTGKSVLGTIPSSTGYPGLSTIAFLGGWGVGNKPGTGEFYISSLYDFLDWDALDFANAEASPDDVVAVYATQGFLFVMGEFNTEVWGVTGALDFPFSRVGGALEWGLIGQDSIAKLGESVAFLARNRLGENQVIMVSGGQAMPISTPDIDRLINDNSDLTGSTAFSFMTNGHQMYVLNAGSETWMYDLKSQLWSQLKSHEIERYRGEIAETFINKIIVSDYSSGKLYRMSDSTYTENGEPIRMEIIGKCLHKNRDYLRINSIQVDMEQGVGKTTGQGSDPQMMLSVSRDQGHTFGSERWQCIGKKGKYAHRTIWRRFGTARDFTLKLAITDPVKRCITGVYGEVA